MNRKLEAYRKPRYSDAPFIISAKQGRLIDFNTRTISYYLAKKPEVTKYIIRQDFERNKERIIVEGKLIRNQEE